MTNNSENSRLKGNYLTIKLAIITLVGLVFLLASFWLNSTIGERKTLLRKAQDDIVLSWAGAQMVIGPVLIVPYTDDLKKDKTGNLVFFPDQLKANIDVSPEVRRRGIFEVLVYQSEFKIDASFLAPKRHQVANKTIHWDQANVAFLCDDVRGIISVNLAINGIDATVKSGVGVLNKEFKGAHSPVNITNEDSSIHLSLNLNMKGSDTIKLFPLAKENSIELSSNWPDPSFIGKFLPNNKSVSKQGFNAKWAVSSLATSLPDYFDASEFYNRSFDKDVGVGVRFLKTADHYQQAERTSKYNFLFILYTFLVFFLYEVVKKTKIHVFQYCITACSLLCFSILLTAFSEHVSFEVAYGLASIAIITQIAFYVFGILHKKFERLMFVTLLTCLYSYLFVVLRLEEVAFLIGAIGMFLAIGVAMYFTKNVQWFEEKNSL